MQNFNPCKKNLIILVIQSFAIIYLTLYTISCLLNQLVSSVEILNYVNWFLHYNFWISVLLVSSFWIFKGKKRLIRQNPLLAEKMKDVFRVILILIEIPLSCFLFYDLMLNPMNSYHPLIRIIALTELQILLLYPMILIILCVINLVSDTKKILDFFINFWLIFIAIVVIVLKFFSHFVLKQITVYSAFL
jgi:hypothetical protein